MSEDPHKCFQCKALFGKKISKLAKCAVCQNFFHLTCAEITSEKYSAMLHNGGQWFCEHCRSGAANLFKQNIALSQRVEYLEKQQEILGKQLKEVLMKLEQKENNNAGDEVNDIGNQLEVNESMENHDHADISFNSIQISSNANQVNNIQVERDFTQPVTQPGSEEKWEETKPKICRYYRRNECKFGKNCKFDHPEQCDVFKKNGLAKFNPRGCDGKCKKLHITACKNSLKKGVCDQSDCKFFHTTVTKQNMRARKDDKRREAKKKQTEPTKEKEQDHFLGQEQSFTQSVTQELKMLREEIMSMIRMQTPQQAQVFQQNPTVTHWPETQAYPGSLQNSQMQQVPRFQATNQGFYTSSQ